MNLHLQQAGSAEEDLKNVEMGELVVILTVLMLWMSICHLALTDPEVAGSKIPTHQVRGLIGILVVLRRI